MESSSSFSGVADVASSTTSSLSLSVATAAAASPSLRQRRWFPPAPPPFLSHHGTTLRALFSNAPSILLVPSGFVDDILDRLDDLDPFLLLFEWYCKEREFIFSQLTLLLSELKARELWYALLSHEQHEWYDLSQARPLAYRILYHLAEVQKSKNARSVPLLLLLHGVVDTLYGHTNSFASSLRSALRVSLSTRFIHSWLLQHHDIVRWPFSDAFMSIVDNFDYRLRTHSEMEGRRAVHRSIILEICIPLPTLVYHQLVLEFRLNRGSWLARTFPTRKRDRKAVLFSVLCFSSDSALFSFVGSLAQCIINVSRPHATARTDSERRQFRRLGYHIDGDRADYVQPFLRPAYSELSSNTASHVAALGYALHEQHIGSGHPLHFVACDCQIYLSLWQRIDEDATQSLSSLFPIPGLAHTYWNYLECLYKLLWETLLGPAAQLLGWRQATRDCHNYDACERLLETVAYAIVRFFDRHFAHEGILQVLDVLEKKDRPTHFVLFAFTHLICPYFELRAQVRSRDFSALLNLLKFMLPTFIACGHRNYSALTARFLVTFDFSLPAVQTAIFCCLANALTAGILNAQACDLILERINRELKELIDNIRVEEQRVARILAIYNLITCFRHAVERNLTGESEEEVSLRVRDDVCSCADIATLTSWLEERLGWTDTPAAQWRSRAARDVAMTYVFSSEQTTHLKPLKKRDEIVEKLNQADKTVRKWLGGNIGDSKIWLTHVWTAESENDKEDEDE